MNGNLIEDYDTADFKHNVAMSSNESTGVFTFSANGSIETYPKNAGQNNVDLYIKFSLDNSVAMDRIINIVSFPLSLQLLLARMQIDDGSACTQGM